MDGNVEIYIPLRVWHNRATYDRDYVNSLNEQPWGFGIGKGYRHENGDWSGFYAMAFKDSNRKIEPIIGWGRTYNMLCANGNWNVGIGYSLGITARSDIFNYTPVPFVAPIISVGYKNISLQGTYIPGTHNRGNVAFFWTKIAF